MSTLCWTRVSREKDKVELCESTLRESQWVKVKLSSIDSSTSISHSFCGSFPFSILIYGEQGTISSIDLTFTDKQPTRLTIARVILQIKLIFHEE
jgi:hypothetical protein